MKMVDEYISYQLKSEQKYGKNTIVLYENGSFYEIYGIDNEKEKIGDLRRIGQILNISVTRKNKKILENSRSNPLLAGVPSHAINKHLKVLIHNKYTVVFIEQITSPPEPERALTRVISPTTFISENSNNNTNYLLSLYLESNKSVSSVNKYLSFGISAIDLTTGECVYYEMKSKLGDFECIFEELYRFIETYDPKEIVIHLKNQDIYSYEEINEKLELEKRVVHNRDSIDSDIFKLDWQNQLLANVYTCESLLTPIETINMEFKNDALISFIILLKFVYEHDEKILKGIMIPKEWDQKKHLILNHNTLYQLNIVPDSTLDNPFAIRSLFDILNCTFTPMGKRLMRERILNPIVNEEILNTRYDLLETMIKSPERENLDTHLKILIDLDRFIRKMGIGYLQPHELANLDLTLMGIKSVIEICEKIFKTSSFSLDSVQKKKYETFCDYFYKTFDLNILLKFMQNNITCSFFNEGVFPELDKIQYDIDEQKKIFEDEAKYLTSLIINDIKKTKNQDLVKFENNERDGYYLGITKKRKEVLMKKLPKNHKYEFKMQGANNIRIMSEKLTNASKERVSLEDKIGVEVKKKYLEVCSSMYDDYNNLFNNINKFIAEVDIIRSNAKSSIYNGYCRPMIKKEDDSSYFKAKGIRHPIIEKIQTGLEYIPNDVELNKSGILLYGLNGGGKSSLLKSIGLSIIMAQMGMFVPCSSFVYYPFKTLYTRIMGNDNIFKGLSSFAVEMTELRTILKNADSSSLILGDEICRGTEIHSALAIVSSSIKWLSEKGTNFLFSTHLHQLNDLAIINEIENLKKYYIDVTFEDGKIIYGRKIREGVGENLYGLEVAEHIIEDDDFSKLASSVRKEILNCEDDIYTHKKSKYNSKVFVHKCEICKKSEKELGEKLDVHHIKSQCNANEQNMIDTISKNRESNLVVLCKQHHLDVHSGKIVLNGFVSTSAGKVLDYKESDEKENDEKVHLNNKKRYTEEQVKMIFEYKKYLNNQSMRNIKYKIKSETSINIGFPTLKKIFNSEYLHPLS